MDKIINLKKYFFLICIIFLIFHFHFKEQFMFFIFNFKQNFKFI